MAKKTYKFPKNRKAFRRNYEESPSYIDPNRRNQLLKDATYFMNEGFLDKAESRIKEALDIDYLDNKSYLNLARIKLKKGSIEEARELFIKLLPSEYRKNALEELFRLELKAGNLEKSAYYIEDLIEYKKSHYLLFKLTSIYSKLGMLRKAYDILINNREIMHLNDDVDYERSLEYLENKLGEERTPKETKELYGTTQLRDYNLEYAKFHVGYHLQTTLIKDGIFSENVEVKKLVENPPISDDSLVEFGTYFDNYIVNYPDVGFDNRGKATDSLKIGTISNTNKVLWMYPVPNKKNRKFLNLNTGVRQLK